MKIPFVTEVLAQHPNNPATGNQFVNIGSEFGFGGYATLGSVVDSLIPIAFSIAGLMVFFYFIIAAFELVTSQGDKAHIVSARSKIYHSIIGLVLLLLLYLVVQFILDTFGLTGLGII